MHASELTRPVELIDPIPEMGLAYRRFLREFVDAGEEGMLLHLPDETEAPEKCIHRLLDHAAGRNLPEGWVPCSTYWLLSGEEMLLGEIRLRHRLTPALEDYGGHIGYMVRPGERRKGHATWMLARVLEKARDRGMGRVMLTCEPENIGSAAVIKKSGGRLINESLSGVGRLAARYWIDLFDL